jgi:hypothetical protein
LSTPGLTPLTPRLSLAGGGVTKLRVTLLSSLLRAYLFNLFLLFFLHMDMQICIWLVYAKPPLIFLILCKKNLHRNFFGFTPPKNFFDSIELKIKKKRNNEHQEQQEKENISQPAIYHYELCVGSPASFQPQSITTDQGARQACSGRENFFSLR